MHRSVHRGHRTLHGNQLGHPTAARTSSPLGLHRHDLRHLTLLNPTTQGLAQFVRPGLDDRIVRHPPNGPIGTIQGYRDLGCLTEEIVQFFLQRSRFAVHGRTPFLRFFPSPNSYKAAILPRQVQILLLTFFSRRPDTQKLTCTRAGVCRNASALNPPGAVSILERFDPYGLEKDFSRARLVLTAMYDLIPPHGGLREPICCTVPKEQIQEFLSQASRLVRVPVSDADLSTVYRFGDGALSPLVGPMNREVYDRVLEEMVIEREGRLYAWTIPLSLPVSADLAKRLSLGQRVALVNMAGQIVADLEISDIFPWDKRKYLAKVYLTERTDHPGADMVLLGDADKTHLLGGRIRVLPQPKDPAFGRYVRTPREVRALLAEKGWDRVVAFQTRNPLHRAHEYALVYGLETLLRAGYNAGACLNPLLGETKGDDVPAHVRMRTYEALIESRSLGEGDSDPELWGPRGEAVPDRVVLLGLDIKMFYAGPKEAVMHAIYRQNFGFTDIIIGRKHADAPYHDGSPIWGDFDAQEIFSQLKGELQIKPLKVGFAAYYASIGRVDLMENHPDERPVLISGKQVRQALMDGQPVDPRIMRESTSRILAEAMARS